MKSILLALVAVAVWSTAAPVAVGASVSVNSLEFVAIILVGAVLSLSIQLAPQGRASWQRLVSLPLDAKLKVLLFGCLVSLYYVCLYTALFYAPSVEANIINYLWPVFYTIFAGLMFREQYPLTRQKIGFMFIGFAGVVLLMFGGNDDLGFDVFNPWYLVALAAAVFAGLYFVIVHQLEPYNIGNRELYLWGLALPAILTAAAVAWIGKPDTSGLLEAAPFALYLGMFVIPVGQTAWTRAIRLFTHPSMSALSFLTPILSTILLFIFFKEHFTLYGLAGACLIILSALLVSSRQVHTTAQLGASIVAMLAAIAMLVKPDAELVRIDPTTVGSLGTIFSVLAGFTIFRLADRVHEREAALVRVGHVFRKLEQLVPDEPDIQEKMASFRDAVLIADGCGADDECALNDIFHMGDNHKGLSPEVLGTLETLDKETRLWLTIHHSKANTGELAVIASIGGLSILLGALGAPKGFIETIVVSASAAAVSYIVMLVRDYENLRAERNFPKINAIYGSFFKGNAVVWPSRVIESPFLPLPLDDIAVNVSEHGEVKQMRLDGIGRFGKKFLLVFVFLFVALVATAVAYSGAS